MRVNHNTAAINSLRHLSSSTNDTKKNLERLSSGLRINSAADSPAELEILVDRAISENPEAWTKFCDGEDKVQGVIVGAVMKATKGQADGKAINSILQQRRG